MIINHVHHVVIIFSLSKKQKSGNLLKKNVYMTHSDKSDFDRWWLENSLQLKWTDILNLHWVKHRCFGSEFSFVPG